MITSYILLLPLLSVYSYEVLQKRGRTFTDSSQCQLGGNPSTPRLASLASGYLATSSLTLGLKLHSVHFADKYSSASQARLRRTCLQSAPEFMFEFTSPRKLGSVNSYMNSGVLEAESVKFSPFSGELHLECPSIYMSPKLPENIHTR